MVLMPPIGRPKHLGVGEISISGNGAKEIAFSFTEEIAADAPLDVPPVELTSGEMKKKVNSRFFPAV